MCPRSSAIPAGALNLAPHEHVRLLGDLAWMLQSLHEEAAILQSSIDLLLARLDLRAGWIFLADPAADGMRLAACRGIDPAFGAAVREPGAGPCLCTEVLESARSMVARNTADCPRLPGMGCDPALHAHACIPLRFGRGVLGVMNIAAKEDATFTEDEMALLETAGRQISLAVDRARTADAEAHRSREAREALLRLQQAHYGMVQAERLSALGTLASCLAHEVRNPLNSINLQLVLLARRAARLDPPAREEHAALIESARGEIVRLDDLVEEFLSLSSIDRLRLEEAEPAEVVQDVVALMLPMARERNVTLVASLQRPLPVMRIDREKMKQVLINLVRNAVEAMPAGGTVTVSCRCTAGRLVLTVADTGTGIEPGLDVFDFFVTTKRGGTGLGLPIARRIVEAHGGTLTFVSSPGQGATFKVEMGAG